MISLSGSIIMALECYEIDFELIDVLMCNLAFLAKGAAFLTLFIEVLQNGVRSYEQFLQI